MSTGFRTDAKHSFLKPAGPHLLGWDRLFVPAGEDATLAQLTAAGEVTEFRRAAYTQVAAALGVA